MYHMNKIENASRNPIWRPFVFETGNNSKSAVELRYLIEIWYENRFWLSETSASSETATGSRFGHSRHFEQVARLSQTDRAAAWVSYGQKWKTGTGRQYFTHIIGVPSTTVTYLVSKAIELGEKIRKIKAITPFKVIQGHWDRYQSKAPMRLPISD